MIYILGIILVLLLWAIIWNTNYQGIKEEVNDFDETMIFSLIVICSGLVWPFTVLMMGIFILVKETK